MSAEHDPLAPDLLDRVLSWDLGFREEHTGGGCWAVTYEGDAGTVVVTDDGDAALIGFYPGDNWSEGDDQGNILDAIPIADAERIRETIDHARCLAHAERSA